jgi:hypothetical protein
MNGGNTAVDQTVGGFYLYVGTGPRSYDRKIRVDVTAPVVATYERQVSGLGVGTYYFTVTAFNGYGESSYGNEVSWGFSVCGSQAGVQAGGQ